MQARPNYTGLTDGEAKQKLKQFGFNELEERHLATLFENFLKILMDPMGLMLLVLSLVYWLLGKTNDSLVLLVAYVPIVGIDVVLELRSQKALRSLKKSLKSTCYVIRNGQTVSIPTRELVPGDFLVLEEGQTLPADGFLKQASNLTIDESSLTGESVPIEKAVNTEALSGTTVLTGSGLIEIQKTGLNSQLGSIAKVLREFEATPSPFLRTINKTVRIVFVAALVLAVIVFLVSYLKGHGIGESLIISLTLAMAAIPEEFPLVFTLYLSLAAYRLSKRGVLVKSLPAVEGLGRVNVICTDKTGTLTEGKFILENLIETNPASSTDLSQRALILSCEPKAVDAMEASIFDFVSMRCGLKSISTIHEKWELQYDYSFDTKDKYMCHVWRERSTGKQFLAMKGAIEGVLARCEPGTDKAHITKLAGEQASAGKRLLGLAFSEGNFTGNRSEDEKNVNFIGILGFGDPVRPSVPAAVKECGDRGVRLKMLTGDHLLTAHAIADAIKLPHSNDELYSGPDLEKLSPETRQAAYRKGAIFARLKPEQKLELVQSLKAEGNIVAMTGDGINDAPALKLADVGISMGERATDVARSSAQMVLLKNDFGGIVDSLIEGQNVLRSLSDSFGYLIAFHIPIIFIALAQSLILESPILQPIHIVLLELIVHPVSAFVFADSKLSKKAKRTSFLTIGRIFWSSARGITLTVFCLLVYYLSLGSVSQRSSLAVLMLVAGNVGLLLAESGGLFGAFRVRPKRAAIASGTLFLLTLTLSYLPPVSSLFLILRPDFTMYCLVLGLGLFCAFTSKDRNKISLS